MMTAIGETMITGEYLKRLFENIWSQEELDKYDDEEMYDFYLHKGEKKSTHPTFVDLYYSIAEEKEIRYYSYNGSSGFAMMFSELEFRMY